MTSHPWSIYTAPGDAVDGDLLRAFMAEQATSRLFTESRTLELKGARHGDNVVRAIAGLANSEGGIVLLGVDEENPDFDSSPGVAPGEVVAIADSCRQLLAPPIQPEILVVPLPDGGRAVLVVRVEADPIEMPILRGGTVLVRAPGQTVPATREQVVSMVRAAESSANPYAGLMALGTRFRPDAEASSAVAGNETRDVLIRIAGAVWLRPTAARAFLMGSSQRAKVLDAFASTAFALQPAWHDPRSRSGAPGPPIEELERSSTLYRAAITYRGDPDTYRVGLHVVKDGPRVGYAVDLETRVRPSGVDRSARTTRGELAVALLEGVEAVCVQLPDAVARAARDAPLRLDDVHAWVATSSSRLSTVLDLSDVSRPVPGAVGAWGFTTSAVQDLDGAATLVREQMMSLYLDLGMDDERGTAERDMDEAMNVRATALDSYTTEPDP